LIEPMLTMRPKPRVFMPSHTAFDMLKQEPRLVSITWSHMSRVSRRMVEIAGDAGVVHKHLDRPEILLGSVRHPMAGAKIRKRRLVDMMLVSPLNFCAALSFPA